MYRYIKSSDGIKQPYLYMDGFRDISGKPVLVDVQIHTTAKSVGEAKRNILKQAKDMLGMPVDYKLTLINPDGVGVSSPVDTPAISYCDKCGSRLTDGGYCPICDHNDEEYYEYR